MRAVMSWSAGTDRIDGEILQKAVHEDSGAGEQHKRKRELEDDQYAGEPAAAMFADAARASFRTSFRSTREERSAGAVPKSRPLKMQRAAK